MSKHPFFVASLSALLFAVPALAQERLADLLAEPAINLSKPDDRAKIVAQMAKIEANRLQNARDRAVRVGLPVRSVLQDGQVREIADFTPDGRPVYRITHNANAAISTGANLIQSWPYSLNGSDVTIGVWDGGAARLTHQEFGGRVTVKDDAIPDDHATHVAGTLIASGVVPAARGMATSAAVDSYDWNFDSSEMAARGATAPGEAGTIYLSNHSYGYISGWSLVGGGSPFRRWEWLGSTSIEEDFGRYNDRTQDQDALAYNAPYYLIFRSAGNDSDDNPKSGDTVALSPGEQNEQIVSYDPSIHPAGDGVYRGGFETIANEGLAKNILTIGSATDAVSNGSRDPAVASLSLFSSCGPTDDGRIKPDLVANGQNLYSAVADGNAAYDTYSGTSMSSPNACGSAALLIQQYGTLFPGQAMRASTLKALLIHTADDIGNPGPDYRYGWGLIDVNEAAHVISDHHQYPDKQHITENQLNNISTTYTHTFVWDGQSPIRATLCWTDPAGDATSDSDSRTPRLQNDLDLKIISPNGSQHDPFVMPFVGTWTTASMNLPASTGVNTTDNVEQVIISTPPTAGTYQVVVSYRGSLTTASQIYSLIISGSTGEEAPPLPLALSSITPNNAHPATITADINGAGLRSNTEIRLTRTGFNDIVATGVKMYAQTLRCQIDLTDVTPGFWNVVATNSDGASSTLADAFTVTGAILSQNFDGPINGWSSQSSTGSSSWGANSTKFDTPGNSYFIRASSLKTTTYLNSPSVKIPANATDLQLKFLHSYDLEEEYDGGRLEISINNGSWFGVESSSSGAYFAKGAYTDYIDNKAWINKRSDFGGMAAWTGNSNTFVETIVNFTDTAKYAGKNVRFRWGLATNFGNASPGWHVDSISLTGKIPPSITAAAKTSSGESVTGSNSLLYQVVRGSEADLSVSASDDGGEPVLTYIWAVVSGPNASVTFTPNGTNAAKNATAVFTAAGDYQIMVTATDADTLTATSTVNIRVAQVVEEVTITPDTASLTVGESQAFSAALVDQFGNSIPNSPGILSWTTNGGGSVNSNGLFTATTAGGPFTLTASSGATIGTADISVTPAPATVTLGNLQQTYDGNPKPVTVTTDPAGLAVAVTYDGSSTAPTNAGSYMVEANIADPNYQGSATGTLVIEPGNTLAVWKNEHFSETEQNAGLADASADPDGDGIPNLGEYALGTHPREFTPPVVATLDGNGLSLVFTRPAGLPDVTYAAESSDSLGNWSPIPLEVIQEGDPETVRARDPLTTGDPSKRFLRLKFGQP